MFTPEPQGPGPSSEEGQRVQDNPMTPKVSFSSTWAYSSIWVSLKTPVQVKEFPQTDKEEITKQTSTQLDIVA